MLCFAEYILITQLLQESTYMNMCVHVYFYNYILPILMALQDVELVII